MWADRSHTVAARFSPSLWWFPVIGHNRPPAAAHCPSNIRPPALRTGTGWLFVRQWIAAPDAEQTVGGAKFASHEDTPTRHHSRGDHVNDPHDPRPDERGAPRSGPGGNDPDRKRGEQHKRRKTKPEIGPEHPPHRGPASSHRVLHAHIIRRNLLPRGEGRSPRATPCSLGHGARIACRHTRRWFATFPAPRRCRMERRTRGSCRSPGCRPGCTRTGGKADHRSSGVHDDPSWTSEALGASASHTRTP